MGVDDEGAKSDPDHAVVTTPAAACDLRIEYSTAITASSATLSLPQHKDRRVLFLSQTNTRIFADATKRRPPHSATLTAETQRTRPSSPALFTPAELWPTLFHQQLLLLTSHTFSELPHTGPPHPAPTKHGRHRLQPRGIPRQCYPCRAGEEAGPRDRLHHPRDGGWVPGEHTRESLQG